jgi:hypothetical protein
MYLDKQLETAATFTRSLFSDWTWCGDIYKGDHQRMDANSSLRFTRLILHLSRKDRKSFLSESDLQICQVIKRE